MPFWIQSADFAASGARLTPPADVSTELCGAGYLSLHANRSTLIFASMDLTTPGNIGNVVTYSLALGGAHGGVPVHDEFHGSAGIGRHFLRYAREHLAGWSLHIARVDMQFAGNQGKQARLARAISADNAGAVATEQAEAGVLEEGARAAAEGDLTEVNHAARSLAAPTLRASVGWQ